MSTDKYDTGASESAPAAEAAPTTVEATPAATPKRTRRRRPESAMAAAQGSNSFGDTFSEDLAEQAKGNFLITVGFPGSGKSTFHSHLYRMCESTHRVDPLHATGKRPGTVDPVMESRINAWRRRFHSNVQVESTDSGDANIFEVALRVFPKTRRKKPLDLRIIEVSGEDLRKLDNSTTGSNVAQMPPALGRMLHDDKMEARKVIMAIMVDPTPDAMRVEHLMDGLLSYMSVHGKKRLKQTKFCLIVPKPAQMIEALVEYRDQYPEKWAKLPKKPSLERYKTDKDIDGKLTSFYLTVLKGTLIKRLKTLATEGTIMRTQFYLGEIEQQFYDEDGVEKSEEVLVTPNWRDATTVFTFLYESFNGIKLKPSLWDRIRGR